MSLIAGPEQAVELPVGQWVIDPDNRGWCLVDTNVGWPQRMWMDGRGGYVSVESLTYPVQLADVDEDPPCPHPRGFNECGHCKRCGVLAGPVRELNWALTVVDAEGTVRSPEVAAALRAGLRGSVEAPRRRR